MKYIILAFCLFFSTVASSATITATFHDANTNQYYADFTVQTDLGDTSVVSSQLNTDRHGVGGDNSVFAESNAALVRAYSGSINSLGSETFYVFTGYDVVETTLSADFEERFLNGDWIGRYFSYSGGLYQNAVTTNLTLHSYTITGSPSPVPEVDLWRLLVVGWVMLGIAIRLKWVNR